MTESKKKKIDGLVYSLIQVAKLTGRVQGLKSGLSGDGRFNYGVNPDEIILKDEIETEEIMNELYDLLGMDEYKTDCYTHE